MNETDTVIALAVEHLSPPQRRAWAALCVERLVRLLCGRQAGKTFLIALWLLVGALLMPSSINVYLALTKESAKRAIWPELLAVGAMLGIDPSCFKLHGGVVSLPNGSTVLVMGTDDKATIESWRGGKLYRVAIDEMGSQSPEWIEYMVTQIVWWCILRWNGAIALLGTPGLVADGYWWEQSKPKAPHEVHHWDVYSNPGIPHAAEFIEETLRANPKMTVDSPAFQREVLGLWAVDDAARVYPYDEDRNGIIALPTTSDGWPVPEHTWSFTVGANLATPERIAWVVLASNVAVPGAFVVEADAQLLDPDEAALRLRTRLDAYPDASCIVDTGDLGAAHVESLRRRFGIAAMHAEGDARKSAIRDMRGAVLAGSVRVLQGERTRALRDSWNVLGWHPRKPTLHNPAQVEQDQVAAAAAFGYRRMPVHSPNPRAHVPTSPAWHERMKQQLLERAAASHRGSHGIGRLER